LLSIITAANACDFSGDLYRVAIPFRQTPGAQARHIAALSLTTITGFACDKSKLDNVNTTTAGKYGDLTEADLAGRDMRGADF